MPGRVSSFSGRKWPALADPVGMLFALRETTHEPRLQALPGLPLRGLPEQDARDLLATAVDERGAFKAVAGFGIGLVVTADILCGGPLTGAAMNPARAFGPELVYNVWESYTWIYYAGPAVGGILAAVLYEILYLQPRMRLPLPGRPGADVDEPRPGDLAAS